MNRRQFLGAASSGALSLALGLDGQRPASAQNVRRPNVVFFCTDDMDFSEVGCCGGRQVLTPHIDRLARGGTKLDAYYVTTSVCTPSRYSALTGRYASRSKAFAAQNGGGRIPCVAWNTYLDPATPTIQSELRRNGYATGFVGKWHLTPDDNEWQKVKDKEEIDAATAEFMREQYEKKAAEIRKHGFTHVDGVYYRNLRAIAIPRKFECMNLDWKTACALDFIDQNRDRPFFLYFATNVPHTTVVKDAAWLVNEFRKDTRYTPKGVLPERPDVLGDRDRLLQDVLDHGFPRGSVISSWIDASLGAIVGRLEELGIRDDTVVIFASDHQSIGKFTCYEGSRSPCIINWGRLPGRGISSSALVSNIDIAPTVFDICGITPAGEMDGRSFLPVLNSSAGQVRDSLLLETAYCRAVVTADRWKYIAMRFPAAEMEKVRAGEPYHTNGTGLAGYWRTNRETVAAYPNMGQFDQLYDLRADPAEATNLFAAPAQATRARAMQDMLQRELRGFPYPFAEFTA